VGTLLVLALVGLYATYWVVRSAVAHGMRDALRSDDISRADLDSSPRANIQPNDA